MLFISLHWQPLVTHPPDGDIAMEIHFLHPRADHQTYDYIYMRNWYVHSFHLRIPTCLINAYT